MPSDLIRLTATEAVSRLKSREVSPLELIDATAARIAAVEPSVNALPTLCLDRARDHAKRLMAGQRREGEDEPGWLGGLPVSIKDLADVAGVRTTYGSPIFKDHVPDKSHPLVDRIERKGGIVVAKSNTPEFGAGGSTFNEVFGRTRNPWNTSLTCGGSTGGGAVSVATGEVWLAHGSDHGGSLRRPATYCSVVGLRPSPGRVTRGTSNNLFSPLSVQGPMARCVPDLALFLDTMAGFCPLDPLTYDAPAVSYVDAVAAARPPKRVAWSANYGGVLDVDRETREICEKAVWRFEEMGCVVEQSRRSVHGASVAAFCGGPRLADRGAPGSDQTRHYLEYRERLGANTGRDRVGRAGTGRILPTGGRDVFDIRHFRHPQCGDTGVRREFAQSRDGGWQEADQLHGRIDAQRRNDHGQCGCRGGSGWVRSFRAPRGFADRRGYAGRGNGVGCRGVVRATDSAG
jgi:Asp-tRNA(Asn)/Glu-tRNA(Gln) amidotransferase A subunit family amidase